ncbi:hypothetical protein COCCADRAFT_91572 [Bipolaris zeicola 26-R-13]|uniref:Uncharacterized protein n=1 Tax=Cochliobolus carbonum (strain 26-R-13) TaxID=930089 RepID=W6YC30_COCC2|nr:uncharacterized protein COCCADRAFT_91572 [Bipolaris zeicola 26-R-13]EUC35173.1 hypothetical protein COCCADRAFT_91572 [Bipolaris zeicola 26-R-13]
MLSSRASTNSTKRTKISRPRYKTKHGRSRTPRRSCGRPSRAQNRQRRRKSKSCKRSYAKPKRMKRRRRPSWKISSWYSVILKRRGAKTRNVSKLLGKKYLTKRTMMMTTTTMKKMRMKTKIVMRKRKRKRRRNRKLPSARSRSSLTIHSLGSSSEILIRVIGKNTDLNSSYINAICHLNAHALTQTAGLSKLCLPLMSPYPYPKTP